MPKSTKSSARDSAPAMTPEAKEQEMIALATQVAEEQLRNRTASSQVICHYLKLGTTNAELEREKIRNENLLLEAKRSNLISQEESEKKYTAVLNAMKAYSGLVELPDEDEY